MSRKISVGSIRKLSETLNKQERLTSPGLSACHGCSAELALRIVIETLGPNMVLGTPPGCMAGVGIDGYNVEVGAKIPTILPLLTNTAATLGGIKEGLMKKGKKDVNVVAFAGDGATADVGFQSISGAAERGDGIIYVMYNNEGYMNTGVQRSSVTPKYSRTKTTPVGKDSRGKEEPEKPISLLLTFHNIPFTAATNVGYPLDFVRKLEEAKKMAKKGMAFIEVFTPCPTGWDFPPSETIKVSKMATKTNIFPLWKLSERKFEFTQDTSNPEPISNYLGMVGKYSHLTDEEKSEIRKKRDQRIQQLEYLKNFNPN